MSYSLSHHNLTCLEAKPNGKRFLFSVILFFQLCIFGALHAQIADAFAHEALAEKVYLQLDNNVYTTDNTIWFKAIVANATLHNSHITSNILYVDLISFEEKVVDSKVIKLKKGVGQGYFDLNSTYPEGVYQIRAYTEWNKNFGYNFVFDTYIQIFSDLENEFSSAGIDNVRRIDSSNTAYKFRADLYPNRIDSKHSKSLKVFINIDDKRDSTWLNKSRDSKFILDFLVPKNAKQVKIGYQTEFGLEYENAFSPTLNTVDIQFFPESGKLVEGLSSKVGFKAVNVNGKGVPIEGKILNKKGELITNFKSNRLGIGSFELPFVTASEDYIASIVSIDNKQFNKRVLLPKIYNQGDVLNVSERNDIITAAVFSNYRMDETTYLKVASRGYQYYYLKAQLINGRYIFSIPKKTLPEGVIVLTVLDQNELPIAERLYFNERNDMRFVVKAALDKSIYKQREEVKMTLETLSSDKSDLISNNSVLVIQKERFEHSRISRPNILSYMLLCSDLKGRIESPNMYFREDTELNIDHLMLTQGWRNYKYKKPIQKLNYKQEKNLTVSGIVNIKDSRLKKRPLDLMLITFDSEKIIQTQEIVAPGSFTFDLPDMYGELKDIIIVPISIAQKEKQKYTIALTKKKPLSINYDFRKRVVVIDSIVENILEDNRYNKQVEDRFFEDLTGVTQLEEVFLEGYKMTPERQEMFDKYGRPNMVIEGEEIKEKEEDWSYGLYSVLMFSYPDKIRVSRNPYTGDLQAKSLVGGRGHVTIIFIDGVPVQKNDYSLLQYMRVDEIKSFELIDFPKDFLKLYLKLNPGARPPFPTGSIISIFTKSGNGLYDTLKSRKTVTVNSVPVLSVKKEFYIPKYDDEQRPFEFNEPDLRSTIFWKPVLMTNEKGFSELSYHHSDNTGDFTVVIESVSDDGRLGYKELQYSVEPND
ncbi:hypothetical protein [Winogradskyella sp.]|uniref:hypothetical protein n=1 Tax=Winogradskyella sp. TaxID=1883156 RepID=UPI00261B1987|nr:hypothetical protein [Winogradskyella sp.]